MRRGASQRGVAWRGMAWRSADGKESCARSPRFAQDRILRHPIDLRARDRCQGVKSGSERVAGSIPRAGWKVSRFPLQSLIAALANERNESASINDPDARCHYPPGRGETRTKRATETRSEGPRGRERG